MSLFCFSFRASILSLLGSYFSSHTRGKESLVVVEQAWGKSVWICGKGEQTREDGGVGSQHTHTPPPPPAAASLVPVMSHFLS